MKPTRRQLVSSLYNIENVTSTRFRSDPPHMGGILGILRVFGGYVMAQAYTVSRMFLVQRLGNSNKFISNMHYNFIRPGALDKTIEFEIEAHEDVLKITIYHDLKIIGLCFAKLNSNLLAGASYPADIPPITDVFSISELAALPAYKELRTYMQKLDDNYSFELKPIKFFRNVKTNVYRVEFFARLHHDCLDSTLEGSSMMIGIALSDFFIMRSIEWFYDSFGFKLSSGASLHHNIQFHKDELAQEDTTPHSTLNPSQWFLIQFHPMPAAEARTIEFNVGLNLFILYDDMTNRLIRSHNDENLYTLGYLNHHMVDVENGKALFLSPEEMIFILNRTKDKIQNIIDSHGMSGMFQPSLLHITEYCNKARILWAENRAEAQNMSFMRLQELSSNAFGVCKHNCLSHRIKEPGHEREENDYSLAFRAAYRDGEKRRLRIIQPSTKILLSDQRVYQVIFYQNGETPETIEYLENRTIESPTCKSLLLSFDELFYMLRRTARKLESVMADIPNTTLDLNPIVASINVYIRIAEALQHEKSHEAEEMSRISLQELCEGGKELGSGDQPSTS
ncbi:unnamed protein product [Caenorhabditis auriculariae]|uniref:Uncharacterized protein n=1 Tax=Caenorhabditis auriculariae TaxID=2777116 RepID=A0A8S1GVQ6_9PELO|nr:unnamed protein product [Caenorhabditis auriculariae]